LVFFKYQFVSGRDPAIPESMFFMDQLLELFVERMEFFFLFMGDFLPFGINIFIPLSKLTLSSQFLSTVLVGDSKF